MKHLIMAASPVILILVLAILAENNRPPQRFSLGSIVCHSLSRDRLLVLSSHFNGGWVYTAQTKYLKRLTFLELELEECPDDST